MDEISYFNSDDPSLIRTSSTTGQLIAATPERLIAQITSPSLLDYELLSDFFLTYRTFIDAKALMTQLIARLGWAVNRMDDFGRIVRVRTFVALRHWILNYFVDDFISNIDLRLHFCNMVNALTMNLKGKEDSNGDIKIIRELKKCWSRTCALYWDMPRSAVIGITDEDVLPGGRIGSRSLTHQQERSESHTPDEGGDDDVAISEWTEEHGSSCMDAETEPGAVDSGIYEDECKTPTQAEQRAPIPTGRPITRQSMLASAHIIPPVDGATSQTKNDPPKRLHNRSGSFSDALRDDRMPLPTPKQPDYDAVLAAVANIPGSLMRGALLPPPSPFLDMVMPSTPTIEEPHFNFQNKEPSSSSHDYTSASSFSDKTVTQSHDGVKKLLGTVRRVLSTKQHMSKQPSNAVTDSKRPTKTGIRRPFSAGPYVRQAEPKIASIPENPEPRIDLLAAGVLESFKVAVREEMRLQNARANKFNPEHCQHDAPMPYDEYASAYNEDTGMYSSENEEDQTLKEENQTVQNEGDDYAGPVVGQAARSFEEEENTVAGQVDSRRHSMPSKFESHPGASSAVVGKVTRSETNEERERPAEGSNHIAEEPALEVRPGPYIPVRGAAIPNLQDETKTNELHSEVADEADTTGFFTRTVSSTEDPFSLDRTPVCRPRSLPDCGFQNTSKGGDQEGDQVESPTRDLEQGPSTRTRSPESLPTANNTTKRISLLSTHSSQPGNRGSSYDKEVAQLALLPDLEDGSIESALLRLEGRYDRPSTENMQVASAFSRLEGRGDPTFTGVDRESAFLMHFQHRASCSQAGLRPHETQQDPRQWQHEEEVHSHNQVPPNLVQYGTLEDEQDLARRSADTSLGSYSSTPLLERNLSFHGAEAPVPLEAGGLTKPALANRHLQAQEVHRQQPSLPTSSPTLLQTRGGSRDDEQATLHKLTDGSFVGDAKATGPYLFDDESIAGESEVLPHPLRHPATPPSYKHPITQLPTTAVPPDSQTSATSRHSRHIPLQPRVEQQIIAAKLNAVDLPISQSKSDAKIEDCSSLTLWNNMPVSNHMPFVMGYDSLTVAQQMTLCEKDALSEIDWRELIEIRWSQTSPAVRDWVELLKLYGDNHRNQSLRGGVDIWTARFNIVVKWAMSEIVLVENIKERAACIVKFIHIAQHARQLRNWATMYQITTALVNSDCSRLKRTWALVPQRDQETLKSLEALIMPMRNFHNLRMEIERTFNEVSEGDIGCIPFIGIYTHDLIYNAQKPAYLPNPEGGPKSEPLINFERLHTAAAIVKTLLRLLEASSRYTFQPVPEVLSRCLWMATLPDEEISRRSELHESSR